MKQLIGIIILAVCIQTADAIITIKTKTTSGKLLISSSYLSNCVEVSPSDDLDAIYTAIKAKLPTAENRWVIRYYPGTYVRTATYLWDADFIDHEGIGPSPDNVIITRAGGGSAVVQTARDIRCSNFTIRNTGSAAGDHGFVINAATNNDPSCYSNMRFVQTNAKIYNRYPVFGQSDLGGTWTGCGDENMDIAWRCAANKSLTATMWYCKARDSSYLGDNENETVTGTGTLKGKLYYCIGRDFCFASCAATGSDIDATGLLVGCVARNSSYSISKTIYGKLYDCVGGADSFAAMNGTIAAGAVLRNCEANGGFSFAMGGDYAAVAGRIENCRNAGQAFKTNLAGAETFASYTTNIPGTNNNLVWRARHAGSSGNRYSVEYIPLNKGASSVYYTQDLDTLSVNIRLRYVASNPPTANQVISLVKAHPAVDSWVAVKNVPGSDGSGSVNVQMSKSYLTGGADGPVIIGCNSTVPVSVLEDREVFPFENGSTYTNQDADSAVTMTLIAAFKGFKYTFVDCMETPGADLTIAARDFDVIAGDDDSKLVCDDGVTQIVTLECFQPGKWTITHSTGKWD